MMLELVRWPSKRKVRVDKERLTCLLIAYVSLDLTQTNFDELCQLDI